MDDVTRPGRVPPEPGQHKEEPEQAMEDDIPSDDRDPDGNGSAPEDDPAQGSGRHLE